VPGSNESVALVEKVLSSLRQGEARGVLASLFIVLGCGCLASFARHLSVGRWPTVRGKVVAVVGERDDSQSVEYQYAVEGEVYVGTRRTPRDLLRARDLSAVLARQSGDLAKSGYLAVIYNPNKPSQAFLDRPGPLRRLAVLLVAGACFAAPFMLFRGGA